MTCLVRPDPNARIVFTKHAEFRMVERAPDLDQHAARDEIIESLLSHRYTYQGRGYWMVWTAHEERRYSIHRGHERGYDDRVTVVVTVLTPLPAAA